jgi:hypothetical protein
MLGRQKHRLHDLGDHRLPLQNAPIGVERESPRPCVENDSASRGFFILDVTRHGFDTLLLYPKVNMAGAVAYTISVGFGFGEQAGIENQSVPQQPEDSHPRFT